MALEELANEDGISASNLGGNRPLAPLERSSVDWPMVGAVAQRIDAGPELGARSESRRILLGRRRQMAHGSG